MRYLAFLGYLFLSIPFLPAQSPLVLDSLYPKTDLRPYLQLLPDSSRQWGLAEVVKKQDQFLPYKDFTGSFSPEISWWGKIEINHPLPLTSDWLLYNSITGSVTLYLCDSSGVVQGPLRSGNYVSASEKPLNKGAYVHIPFSIGAQQRFTLYLRYHEIDRNPIPIRPYLHSAKFSYKIFENNLNGILPFFQGIFWIMILYNLILFFTLRFPAYLYYALYLLSMSTFISFAVGVWSHPPIGNLRWLLPIGYLGFGCVDIFYFLFGRSLLDLKRLLPKWDRFLFYYLIVKAVILIGVQIGMYVSFHVPLSLGIEACMLFLDILVSVALFVSLLKTKSRLGLYFVLGSSSVIIIGMTIAVTGHIIGIPYSFRVFMCTVIIEIIFFSLGLGYRIRQTEKEKLAAEKAEREAQEALNQELTKVNTAFGRFVPHAFLKSLGKDSVLDVALGDSVEKEVTVLFSDIRGYTTLSEQMSPKENFDFLNQYLGIMGPIIQEHQGFVNQYYGDGIMALFLASPQDALNAAREMWQRLHTFNLEWTASGRPAIRIGIGLHTGPLMMGVIGDTLRMDAGVVSDTVNTAARMEGLTKFYTAGIVLSEQVWQGLSDREAFGLRSLGKVQVKGRASAMEIYECFDGEVEIQRGLKRESVAQYQAALSAYYRRELVGAAHLWEEVLALNPQDGAAAHFKQYSEQYLLKGLPKNWDGVERWQFK